jgi:hypothetical protein
MTLGSVSEVVTVEAGAPLVNTTSGTVSTVIDRTFVDNLPLNGRSFQTLIGTFRQGLIHVHQGRVDRYTTADGLSNDTIGASMRTGKEISGSGRTTASTDFAARL